MTIYVKVSLDGPFHGKVGEAVGFAVEPGAHSSGSDRVLVALEDGQLKTFHPSVLRRIGVRAGFFQRLTE